MNNTKATRYAILAALLYALSTPFSKILLEKLPPTILAGFLYLGAGIGMTAVYFISSKQGKTKSIISHKNLPYLSAMVVLDIAAPILLMVAIKHAQAESISLLNNFEIVATSVIALLFFKEKITSRLWCGIGFITLAGILLSADDISSFAFSSYSLYAILACVCWGFENNCTRKLSHNDPAKIVIIKGFGSGTGAFIVALLSGNRIHFTPYIIWALLLGFVAYGMSVFFYVCAQKYIGAARTAAFYALAPFIGAILSIAIFPKMPSLLFIFAFLTMAVGTYLTSHEKEENKMNKRDFKFDKRADKYDDHF